jgi:hypothetical protein
MATILDFRSAAERPRGRHGRVRSASSAEVVLFPGVRYERWDDAPAPAKKRGRRSRDTIDIND